MAAPVRPVFSADRVRRLRIALTVGLVLGGLLLLFAVAVVMSHLAEGLYGLVLALLVLGANFGSLRFVRAGRPQAKTAVITTGGLEVLAGLALAGTLFLLLLPVLGIVVLFLALLADHPERTSGRS